MENKKHCNDEPMNFSTEPTKFSMLQRRYSSIKKKRKKNTLNQPPLVLIAFH